MQDKAKVAVLTAARKKKQITWRDMRVCFFQDYAQELQEKRKKYDEEHCYDFHIGLPVTPILKLFGGEEFFRRPGRNGLSR